MVATLQPLKALSEREQAVYFHSRERRKSLAGIPELHRTHRIFGGTEMAIANIATAVVFPVRNTLITFKTAIRITAADPTGLVFELGSSSRAIAVWVDNNLLRARAGSAATFDSARATFNNTVDLPIGLEMEIIVAVRPGDGRIRLWGNGTELDRDTSVNGDFGTPSNWAAGSAGSFAAAVQGTTTADVSQTGAPTNFEVIEPLSVYMGQVPRHFV